MNVRALSVRQPWAELILRGIKTAEFRSRPTKIIGERFYLYASKGAGVRGQGAGKALAHAATLPARPSRVVARPSAVWSEDLAVPGTRGQPVPPTWMIELAAMLKLIEADAILPTGVIVGSAVIEKVTPPDPADGEKGLFRWHLTDVERITTPRKPSGRPQPVWFAPF